jgi:hypothetical protein
MNNKTPPANYQVTASAYAITVELRAPQTIGEEVVRNGPNMLSAQFAKPETSGLKFTVAEGENAIPPIEIPAR